MAEQPLRTFIAIPDATVSPLWTATFRSILSQSSHRAVTLLVNVDDPRADLGDHLASWHAEIDAWARTHDCPPMGIVVSRHRGLGYFETLDSICSAIPPLPDVIVSSIRCGARLNAGALAAVQRIFADRPDVDLLRGMVPDLATDGLVTSLSFDDVHDTWHALGAVCDVERDLCVMRGGMFFRAALWHRVGRLDASLRYAGFVDLYSKAAAAFQLAKIEALLVTDGPAATGIDDRRAKVAEVARVQLTAAARQRRHLSGIVERRVALRHPLRLFYDRASGGWQAREPSRFLDVLGLVEIESGFHEAEGPVPELSLPDRFRWTSNRRATFGVVAAEVEQRIYIRLRNPSPRQVVALFLNGRQIAERRPESASLLDTVEFLVTAAFAIGRNRLTLAVDMMLEADEGRNLGIIVETVEVIGNNVLSF